jgi:hypothetical protein
MTYSKQVTVPAFRRQHQKENPREQESGSFHLHPHLGQYHLCLYWMPYQLLNYSRMARLHHHPPHPFFLPLYLDPDHIRP